MVDTVYLKKGEDLVGYEYDRVEIRDGFAVGQNKEQDGNGLKYEDNTAWSETSIHHIDFGN